jgi:hypothetical protein
LQVVAPVVANETMAAVAAVAALVDIEQAQLHRALELFL